MYKFKTFVVGGFKIIESCPTVGTTHSKRFSGVGVTPVSQATLNLYISGRFTIVCPEIGLNREMLAGDTSLDMLGVIFADGAVVVETALTEGVRYCVEPADPTLGWTRGVYDLPAAVDIPIRGVAVVLRGSVLVAGQVFTTGAIIHAATTQQSVTSDAPARVAVMWLNAN